MRIVVALMLVVGALLFSYWAFVQTFARSHGLAVEWVLITAVGWLLFFDTWQILVARFPRRALRWWRYVG